MSMHSPRRLPVLVTSAIKVSAGNTALRSVEERVRETIRGLGAWMSTPDVEELIVCDGSGFDLTPHLQDLMRQHPDVFVEILSFQNDAEGVKRQGKGYGEGQIIEHALSHSAILCSTAAFAKCTGKLWVRNYADCLDAFNGIASFDFNGLLRPRFVDTRFYMVDIGFYRRNLSSAFLTVDDDAGFFLEHAFKDSLANFGLSTYVMAPTPRVAGVSGSMSISYGGHAFKSFLRDIRSYALKRICS
jgi:hypothetical protein